MKGLEALSLTSVLLLSGACQAWSQQPVMEGDGSLAAATPILGDWTVSQVADEILETPITIQIEYLEDYSLRLTGNGLVRSAMFSGFGDYYLISIDNSLEEWFLAKVVVEGSGERLRVEALDMGQLRMALSNGEVAGTERPLENGDFTIRLSSPSADLASYFSLNPQAFVGPAAYLDRSSPSAINFDQAGTE